MSRRGEGSVAGREDAVEALLEQAPPRPAPPADDERLVRAAVYAEWRVAAGKRQAQRRRTYFAVAATVLIAVAVGFNAFRVTDVAPVQVAAISKSHGSVYLLGEQSELTEAPDLVWLVSGQTIVTGDGSGVGLAWEAGGSLRIDEATMVEFRSANEIYLREGRVYFDSRSEAASGGLTIATEHGLVSHLGTQYMASVDSRTLVVSVREGKVAIERGGGLDTAHEGQQFEFVAGAPPNVTNISGSGMEWLWVEATAPTLDFSGRSTYEFLQWVAREIGHRVVFENADAERVALEGSLIGTIPDVDPRAELEIRMMGEDLDYRIDGDRGTIVVSSIDSGS